MTTEERNLKIGARYERKYQENRARVSVRGRILILGFRLEPYFGLPMTIMDWILMSFGPIVQPDGFGSE